MDTHSHHDEPDMLSVEEARDRILAMFQPLNAEYVDLLDALGQVLDEDIVSDIKIPPLANSAMDGYAVQHADIVAAKPETPVTLNVDGYIAAGQLPDRPVTKGNAIRIMTGAPIPPGANTVIPFEDTSEYELKNAGMNPMDLKRGIDSATKAIVEDLTYEFTKLSDSKVRIEGSAESGWVLLDCEWLIIHIFINESREFYRLDEFWINSREIIRIL